MGRSECRLKRCKRAFGSGGDGEIGGETAHGIAHEGWILANRRNPTRQARPAMRVGYIGHITFDLDDEIGVLHQLTRIKAHMHGMA